MEPHALGVLVLIVIAFGLFSVSRVPLETTSLGVIAALVIGFSAFPYDRGDVRLQPQEFFYGFGHEALVTICALMVLGRSLALTGALEPVARLLGRALVAKPRLAMLGVLIFCASASGILNDTPIVVIMLPVLVSAALRSGTSPATTLMPMNYAVLVGGMGTTIGTSTNLLVVAIAADLGVRRFGMFEFLPVTAIAAVFAILYLWLVLPRLLPERTSPLQGGEPSIFFAVLRIPETGQAVGKPLAEVSKKRGKTLRIERVVRNELELTRLPTLNLQADDRLFVRANAQDLREFAHAIGASMHNVGDLANEIGEDNPLAQPDQRLAEVVVTERSLLDGRTLRAINFADRYDVIVIGVHRTSGAPLAPIDDVADVTLRAGDVLLVQGGDEQIGRLRASAGLLVLATNYEILRTAKAPLALAILAGVIASAALGIVPIYASALAGVVLLVLTRCIDWDEAAGALSTKVILLVAASLALGTALTRTGGTDLLAAEFIALTQSLDRDWVLPLLMLLMAMLTNFVSNNAAVAIGTPIAVSIGQQLGVAPEPLVLAVLFGANFSYLTPMAYQTNLLVMAAGGYRFLDFVRGGAPLLVLMLVAYSWLLPRFFPL